MVQHVLGCNPGALGTFILWACLVLPPHEVTEKVLALQKGPSAACTTTLPSAQPPEGWDTPLSPLEGKDGMCGSCVSP